MDFMRRVVCPFICIVILSTFVFAQGFPAVRVYKTSAKAVVLIIAQKDGKGSMIGAGSIISPQGYVVTNAHVVIDKRSGKPYSAIRVFLKPDKVTGNLRDDLANKYKARVTSYDIDLDLALLEVPGLPSNAGSIQLADPREINVGEEVVAIGHPEQGGLWSLTYGRISGQIENQGNVRGKDVYQTDTSVNRGNSGGPLLDRRGYMVGINTNIARLGTNNLPITGVNFALKSSVAKKWLARKGILLAYGQESLYDETKRERMERGVAQDGEDSMTGVTELKGENTDDSGKRMTKIRSPNDLDKSADVDMEHQEKRSMEPQADSNVPMMGKSGRVEEEKMPDDGILTPKRPYDIDDLYKEAEADMEDMMEEMKLEIRKRQ